MSINIWPSDRDAYHGDIVQGSLGNCFLIASLQAIASCQPVLLKSIISVSPLTCYFYRQGKRIEVPIEIESLKRDTPYCRSTVDDVYWPYVIEQAYAQLYGGQHENLAGGNTSEALYDLLGKPVEEFEPNDRDLWEKIEKGLSEKNILVTCGSVVTNNTARTKTTSGLVINHAYSILATYVYYATREKYVVIHNPHGTNHVLKENIRARKAFFDSISSNHPMWSNTPGTQLISWSELRKTCNRIQICHLYVEPRQVLSGEWTSITSGGCSNFSTFYRNPFILFPLSFSNINLLVLGHTTDQRHQRTETDVKLNYPQLGITLVQLRSHAVPTQDNYEIICQSKFWNKREVTLCLNVQTKPEREYAAILSNFYPNINGTFWVQAFSKPQLPILTLRDWTHVFGQTIQTVHGEWNRGNAGGRRNRAVSATFYKNPAYLLTVSNATTVLLILRQYFQKEIPLEKHHPIAIYIVSPTKKEEPKFMRARSVSSLVQLNPGEEYYVVLSCFESNSFAKFELNVLCDVPFTIDPTERKLPPPPPSPEENSTSDRSCTIRRTASPSKSPVRASKPVTTIMRPTKRETPKPRNSSLATARLTSLIDEYSKRA